MARLQNQEQDEETSAAPGTLVSPMHAKKSAHARRCGKPPRHAHTPAPQGNTMRRAGSTKPINHVPTADAISCFPPWPHLTGPSLTPCPHCCWPPHRRRLTGMGWPACQRRSCCFRSASKPPSRGFKIRRRACAEGFDSCSALRAHLHTRAAGHTVQGRCVRSPLSHPLPLGVVGPDQSHQAGPLPRTPASSRLRTCLPLARPLQLGTKQ